MGCKLRLDKELALYGCERFVDEFEQALEASFYEVCADLTIEDLLCNEDDRRERYLRSVRRRTSAKIPEPTILRRLNNLRKSGKFRPNEPRRPRVK